MSNQSYTKSQPLFSLSPSPSTPSPFWLPSAPPTRYGALVSASEQNVGFKVIATDRTVYGPVALPELVGWVRDGRVLADTWVYLEREDAWRKAVHVTELRLFFDVAKGAASPGTERPVTVALEEIPPALLRRVKVLAELSHGQLERFLPYAEVLRLPMATGVVKRGTPGDALFMVLEGELRVSLVVTGSEKMLTLLGAGEFFGEGSVFDRSPRSADVITNTPCTLLKVTTARFERLMAEAPDIATPLLFAMGKTLMARIRADNRRYGNALAFGPVAEPSRQTHSTP